MPPPHKPPMQFSLTRFLARHKFLLPTTHCPQFLSPDGLLPCKIRLTSPLYRKGNSFGLCGDRFVYLGFLPCFWTNFSLWSASTSMPFSNQPANSHLNQIAVGYLLVLRCDKSLTRTDVSLPPVFMMRLSRLASSYAPGFSGSACTFSFMNFDHRLRIGILRLYRRDKLMSTTNEENRYHLLSTKSHEQTSRLVMGTILMS